MTTTPTVPTAHLHHVGVQTFDLDNSLAWYRDFLGCRPTWTAETFSELTLSRLPGVSRITEVVAGGVRLHLIERTTPVRERGPEDRVQFQHVCLAVDNPEELVRHRDRWQELYASGRYDFLLPDPPSGIVTDAEGVQSFYCLDVNGLEIEFTYVPESSR
ncbi:VOC family protein [Streptomyces huiliensis]|uniref:VOC family protein n=1 Tax=Streptomyces huiliensis TaxID=2876027 RepID=UPI001CC0911F|nr:VOC family protein [Streptomyces huiliensis]MBZ4324104.1 VOC family protein [Streptomyces huiliensis]